MAKTGSRSSLHWALNIPILLGLLFGYRLVAPPWWEIIVGLTVILAMVFIRFPYTSQLNQVRKIDNSPHVFTYGSSEWVSFYLLLLVFAAGAAFFIWRYAQDPTDRQSLTLLIAAPFALFGIIADMYYREQYNFYRIGLTEDEIHFIEGSCRFEAFNRAGYRDAVYADTKLVLHLPHNNAFTIKLWRIPEEERTVFLKKLEDALLRHGVEIEEDD